MLVDGIASLIESSAVPSSRFAFDSIIGRWRRASMSALARSVFVVAVGSPGRPSLNERGGSTDESILELSYYR